MYINIHTHNITWEANTRLILNVLAQDVAILPDNIALSVGIHPWFIPSTTEEQQKMFQTVESIASLPEIWAIGEIGLDKGMSASLILQEFILKKLLYVAKYAKKPVFLHCVGYFDRLLSIFKEPELADIPRMLHGFMRKKELAQEFIKSGFYLSFGAALLYPERYPQLIQSFLATPLQRFFLETDDNRQHSIAEVYQAAANLKNISVFDLQSQLLANFEAFFGKTATELPFVNTSQL